MSVSTAAPNPVPAPDDCQTMAEVRVGVDALDRRLVALLAERQRYMDAAARIKADRAAVRDEARIDDVVAKVKGEARRAGLSESIAEPVWRLLIERCIAHEFEAWDRLRG
jgi:isochorismate pyruvate lyase